MMTARLQEDLALAAQEVFEKTAFTEICILQTQPTGKIAFERDYIAQIKFQGKVKGTLLLNCSQKFLQTLTQNMLGEDPDATISKGQLEDTAREIVNMILGNFLAKSDPETKIAQLSSPTVFHVQDVSAGIHSDLQFLELSFCSLMEELENPDNHGKLWLRWQESPSQV